MSAGDNSSTGSNLKAGWREADKGWGDPRPKGMRVGAPLPTGPGLWKGKGGMEGGRVGGMEGGMSENLAPSGSCCAERSLGWLVSLGEHWSPGLG